MRLHRNMLRAWRSICFLNDYIRLLKALVYIPMPNTKAMADIGAFLGSYAEVGRVVVRNGMMFVYKRSAFRHCFNSIEHARQWLVLHINQVERLIRLPFCRRGNGSYRVADKTRALYSQYRLILNLTTIAAKLTNIIQRQHNDRFGYSRGINF